MSDVSPLQPVSFITAVSRCADRATYNPDAERAADEVPKVFENDQGPLAGTVWSEAVKWARFARMFAEGETRRRREAAAEAIRQQRPAA